LAALTSYHSEGNPGANLKSIFHRCYLREVAFEQDLTRETIHLPLGCLQDGGVSHARGDVLTHVDGVAARTCNGAGHSGGWRRVVGGGWQPGQHRV